MSRPKSRGAGVSKGAGASKPAAAAHPRVDRRGLFIALGLCLITLAVFSGVGSLGFVGLDDDRYVFENPVVSKGLSFDNVLWAFFTYDVFYWQPITWLSHMLDCEIYGLHPGGHHVTNLIFHTASVVLLFFLLRRMTGATWRSALAAALFAIHPLRVESVAWIAERKDVLSCFTWLITLWVYVSYVRAPSAGTYWRVFLAAVVAIMCKPAVVTLPFVLLLLDYWPLDRLRRETLWPLIREKLPLLVLSFAASLLTYRGQERFGAMEEMAGVPLPARLANAVVAYVCYLRDVFWPGTLAVPYPYRTNIPAVTVLLSLALLGAITWLVVRYAHRRYLPVGWFWFAGALVPMIGIVQVGMQARADRFTYIPSIGLTVLLVWGAAELAGRFAVSARLRALAAALVILAFGARAWAQVPYWTDTLTLLEHSVAVTRDNQLAHYNLGTEYLLRRRPADAERHFRVVVKLSPDAVNFIASLGNALVEQRRYTEALPLFEEALRRDPKYGLAMLNKAITLTHLGHPAAALESFRNALACGLPAKKAAQAHNEIAGLLVKGNHLPEAVAELRQALALDPGYHRARVNLARILVVLGQAPAALAEMEAVLAADPAYPGAREEFESMRARAQAR